jgi:hypothetical protein
MAFLIQCDWADQKPAVRVSMAAWLILVVLTLGVQFYIRFLVALCQEFRRMKIRYVIRIRPTLSRVPLSELKQKKQLRARAA